MVLTAWKRKYQNAEVSSIVNWGYQDNFKTVYFFTKIFCA